MAMKRQSSLPKTSRSNRPHKDELNLTILWFVTKTWLQEAFLTRSSRANANKKFKKWNRRNKLPGKKANEALPPLKAKLFVCCGWVKQESAPQNNLAKTLMANTEPWLRCCKLESLQHGNGKYLFDYKFNKIKFVICRLNVSRQQKGSRECRG